MLFISPCLIYALLFALSVVRSGDYYLFETDSEEEEEEEDKKDEDPPRKSAFQVTLSLPLTEHTSYFDQLFKGRLWSFGKFGFVKLYCVDRCQLIPCFGKQTCDPL